jgi:hypothetical protein
LKSQLHGDGALASFFSFSNTGADDLVDTACEGIDLDCIKSSERDAAFRKDLDIAAGEEGLTLGGRE